MRLQRGVRGGGVNNTFPKVLEETGAGEERCWWTRQRPAEAGMLMDAVRASVSAVAPLGGPARVEDTQNQFRLMDVCRCVRVNVGISTPQVCFF